MGLVLAFIFGALANRLRLSPLVGYLIAGVIIGPYTPGFVADTGLAAELAEIGVILLMFGVGLHFSLKDLMSVRATAVPGAIAQMACATALGAGLAVCLGWSIGAGIVFGLALSVASTVVLLRALNERHLVTTERGQIAVGWLIVEDFAMVLALVLLPPLAEIALVKSGDLPGDVSAGMVGMAIGWTIIKVGGFVVLMLAVGRKIIPRLLHVVAATGSHELFRLCVLAIALGGAFGAAQLFGVSLALGAFFAGMILAESELSQQAAEDSLPLRDAFAVLFFVSVGMLFDPFVLWRNPVPLLATVGIIVLGKSFVAYAIMRIFRQSRHNALTIAVSLAQIGEFSFILASLGLNLGLINTEAKDLILGGAILSIMVNPFLFQIADRFAPARREEPAARPEDHTVVVGYGRVGAHLVQKLWDAGKSCVVIEDNDEYAAALQTQIVAQGRKSSLVINGNALHFDVQAAANLASAKRLFLAIPDCFAAGQIAAQAHAANPAMVIVGRARTDAEEAHLREKGAKIVAADDMELARGMVEAAYAGEKTDTAQKPKKPKK